MLGTPPKSGLKVLRKGLEAKSGLKGLEAPGGPWRPLRPLEALGGKGVKTFAGPELLTPLTASGGSWRPLPPQPGGPCKPACGGPVFLLEGARRRSFRGGN